jgi:hypothetical protein
MNAEPFLSSKEIENLTDKKRRPAQVKVLKSLGIQHKVRPDGSIAILRAHINKVFDGNDDTRSTKREKTVGPNWAAV